MSFISGKKALVTGATGFVGGHMARRLLAENCKVRLLVRKSGDQDTIKDFESKGVEIVYGDLTNATDVLGAVAGVDYVFHIGALYRQAKFPDEVYFDVNLNGTRNILDACEKHAVKRMLYCSTTGVHSHIESPPADENAPFNPSDVYQVSKAQAELLATERFKAGRVNGAIIRPAMIWGEGDTRFLKMFKGIAHRRMPMIGSGKTWTHWIYVHDLVEAFLLAAEKDAAQGQVYLIAGKQPVTLSHVFETIAKLAGVELLPFKIPVVPLQVAGTIVETICRPLGIEPPLHRRRVNFFVKNRAFKTEKAQRELGFCPRYSFEEEAGRIYEWYKSQGWL